MQWLLQKKSETEQLQNESLDSSLSFQEITLFWEQKLGLLFLFGVCVCVCFLSIQIGANLAQWRPVRSLRLSPRG